MAERYDVVVIGCGVVGAATAWYATRAGLKVLAVDRAFPAAGTSGASFAWTGAHSKAPLSYHRFSLLSVDEHERLAREEGVVSDFHRVGSLVPHLGEAEAEKARAAVEKKRAQGFALEWLESPALRKAEPALGPEVAGASRCALDGHINPFTFVHDLLQKAVASGAGVRRECAVLGVDVEGGNVRAVRLPSGRVETPWVVVAAGVETRAIGRMVGLEIPVIPVHGELLVTERLPPFLHHILEPAKQTTSGNVLLGTVREEGVDHTETTWPALVKITSHALRILPRLQGVRLIRTFGGVRPVPADGHPIISRTPIDGFLVAVMHSGITLAPLVGRSLTALMTGKPLPAPIEEYSLERFTRAAAPAAAASQDE
jgi:sarcosine oxidase subunit beta